MLTKKDIKIGANIRLLSKKEIFERFGEIEPERCDDLKNDNSCHYGETYRIVEIYGNGEDECIFRVDKPVFRENFYPSGEKNTTVGIVYDPEEINSLCYAQIMEPV